MTSSFVMLRKNFGEVVGEPGMHLRSQIQMKALIKKKAVKSILL